MKLIKTELSEIIGRLNRIPTDIEDTVLNSLIGGLERISSETLNTNIQAIINLNINYIKTGDTSYIDQMISMYCSDDCHEVFFCLPMKTWSYKQEHIQRVPYSILYAEKNELVNTQLKEYENDLSFIDSIQRDANTNILFEEKLPKLLALKLLESDGEVAIEPKHFALFIPEFFTSECYPSEHNVTLYFPSIYLDRHLKYKQRVGENKLKPEEILHFLSMWFKGHEFGHFIKNQEEVEFWPPFEERYSKKDFGTIQELMADLFGVQMCFQQESVQNNFDVFVETYLTELKMYSTRLLENPGSWFEDSFAANIQLHFLSGGEDIVDLNSFNISIEHFRDKMNELFRILYQAISFPNINGGWDIIDELLTHKTINYEKSIL